MNWEATFTALPAINLPDGRKLETLADCRTYILALPSRQQEAHWQDATDALLKAAQHGGPFLFIARVAFSRALSGTVGVEGLAPGGPNARTPPFPYFQL
jgi:hypothetical protein